VNGLAVVARLGHREAFEVLFDQFSQAQDHGAASLPPQCHPIRVRRLGRLHGLVHIALVGVGDAGVHRAGGGFVVVQPMAAKGRSEGATDQVQDVFHGAAAAEALGEGGPRR
jgi:hypothetical protein